MYSSSFHCNARQAKVFHFRQIIVPDFGFYADIAVKGAGVGISADLALRLAWRSDRCAPRMGLYLRDPADVLPLRIFDHEAIDLRWVRPAGNGIWKIGVGDVPRLAVRSSSSLSGRPSKSATRRANRIGTEPLFKRILLDNLVGAFRDTPAAGVGRPGGGDAGLNRVRYRYRLLPHISDTPLTTVNTAS
jgi:hypothetical protein